MQSNLRQCPQSLIQSVFYILIKVYPIHRIELTEEIESFVAKNSSRISALYNIISCNFNQIDDGT